jgi:type II secretory pathway component PulF
MPTFRYKALQTDGAIAEGQLEATGRPDAFRQMEGLGLRPVSLLEGPTTGKQADSSLAKSVDFSFKLQSQRVSARALENFTRLLSSLRAYR